MNNDSPDKVCVAVVQAAPVLLDRGTTVAKACRLVAEAADQGADLVLFPEAFIPAYPRGLSFGMVVGSRSPAGRELWRAYWQQAVTVPGPVTDQLGRTACEAGVYLGIGVIERDNQHSGGTLYCTLLIFGPDGRILHKHRKLKPTGAERLIWGEGDGHSLRVVETSQGRMGGLICWENYMPLARMALYSQGVEFYLAPTADARDTWQATLRHIACEGRCFVLGSNQYVTKTMLPAGWRDLPEMAAQPETLCRGGSTIIGPLGEVMAGPLYDQEGILYAELDRQDLIRSKLDFDVVGHYARPDVFDFRLRTPTLSADDVNQGV